MRSGWFSCRSACYLAAGRPVVVQDTGLRGIIPIGEGVLLFSDENEAAAAIRGIEGDYHRHSTSALSVAVECFDSDRVLNKLIEEASHGKG
jgi:hypothetical protein